MLSTTYFSIISFAELFFWASHILLNSDADVCIFTAVGLASTSSVAQLFIFEIKSPAVISLKLSSDCNLTATLKQPTMAMAGAPLTWELLY